MLPPKQPFAVTAALHGYDSAEWDTYMTYGEHEQEIYNDFKEIVKKIIDLNYSKTSEKIFFVYTYKIEKRRLYPKSEKIIHVDSQLSWSGVYDVCLKALENKDYSLDLYTYYILYCQKNKTLYFKKKIYTNNCVFYAIYVPMNATTTAAVVAP